MKMHFIKLLLIFIPYYAFAQKNLFDESDSLRSELFRSPDDTSRVLLLVALSENIEVVSQTLLC